MQFYGEVLLMAQQNILKGHLKAIRPVVTHSSKLWPRNTHLSACGGVCKCVCVHWRYGGRKNEKDRQAVYTVWKHLQAWLHYILLALYYHLWVHSVYFPMVSRLESENAWMRDDGRGSYFQLKYRDRSTTDQTSNRSITDHTFDIYGRLGRLGLSGLGTQQLQNCFFFSYKRLSRKGLHHRRSQALLSWTEKKASTYGKYNTSLKDW